MTYSNFKKLVRDLPLFSPQDFTPIVKNKQVFHNQISQWKKSGLLVPLKKGAYVLNGDDRKMTPSKEYIANQLVFPSYISMEYALSFYGIIPERVYQTTSVTAKKTVTFENSIGTFSYRSLQSNIYFGYKSIVDENGMTIFIAEQEKALLDFLYFKLPFIDPQSNDLLQESYRMENLEKLDLQRIEQYAQRFNSKKLYKLIQTFLQKV